MSINPAKANSGTTQTFVTAFVTNIGLLTFQVGVFLYLKQHLGRVYSPRTYLPPPDKRAPELPPGLWRWFPAVLLTEPRQILHSNGLDAYMFLRFIRMLMIIFFGFTLLTWPVLLPINAARIPNPNTTDGLEKLSWSNISHAAENRYAAHIIVVWILTGFVIYMARREMFHFVHMRHEFLISKSHSKQANARTVLITSLPDDIADEHSLKEWASFVPGGIEKSWIYRDTRELNELFKEREDACKKLEGAAASILRDATKAWTARQTAHTKEVKRLKKVRKQELKALKHAQKEGRVSATIDPEQMVGGPEPVGVEEGDVEAPPATWEFLEELVPLSTRPMIRPGSLGWAKIGQSFEAYKWCKDEITRLNAEIAEGRKHIASRKSLGTAFIECTLQLGAHVLAQCVSYHEPLKMVDKWIEISPKDVIWRNLDDSAYEMWTRKVTSWIFTIALIILWIFPTSFIGTLSNLDDLCAKFSWLRWVCLAHDPLPGLIQGVLPPLALAILMAILPFILRGLAWYENIPLKSLLSVSVYKRYYAFLVLHGFLIVTLSSAVTSMIWSILQTPGQAVERMAEKLPQASIFFLTYMVTQGLAGAASALIQLGALVVHFIKKWFLGRTPRQAYEATFVMPSADFGVILPRMSLLCTIGFAYSVISPVINGLAMLSFFLFYVAWKFLLTYVFDQPDEMETGGLYFPLAINNLFVGLYIEQICLVALFALKIPNAENKSIFIAEAAIMVLLIGLTLMAQQFIRSTFEPIMNYLPMSLATKKINERYRKRRESTAPPPPQIEGTGNSTLAAATAIVGKVEEEVVDLFNREKLKQTLRHRLRLRPERNADNRHAKRTDSHNHDDKKSKKKDKKKDDDEKIDEKQTDKEQQRDHPTTFAQGTETPPTLPVVIPSDHDLHTPSTVASSSSNRNANGAAPLLRRSTSGSSKSSKKSKHEGPNPPSQQARSDSPSEIPKTGGVMIAPAAPGLRAAEEEDEEEEFEEHAFDHPSTYADQAWIWLPHDLLGFSELMAEDLRAVGVEASDLGATLDMNGTVEVSRNPPDEDWAGGHDR